MFVSPMIYSLCIVIRGRKGKGEREGMMKRARREIETGEGREKGLLIANLSQVTDVAVLGQCLIQKDARKMSD